MFLAEMAESVENSEMFFFALSTSATTGTSNDYDRFTPSFNDCDGHLLFFFAQCVAQLYINIVTKGLFALSVKRKV